MPTESLLSSKRWPERSRGDVGSWFELQARWRDHETRARLRASGVDARPKGCLNRFAHADQLMITAHYPPGVGSGKLMTMREREPFKCGMVTGRTSRSAPHSAQNRSSDCNSSAPGSPL